MSEAGPKKVHDAEIVVPIHVMPVEANGYIERDIDPMALIVLRPRPDNPMHPAVTEASFARTLLGVRDRYPKAAIAVPLGGSVVVEVVHPNRFWEMGRQMRQPGT